MSNLLSSLSKTIHASVILTIFSNSHPDEFNLLLTVDFKSFPKQDLFTCIKPKCNLSGLSFFALYRTKHSSAYTVEKKHVSNKINKNFINSRFKGRL